MADIIKIGEKGTYAGGEDWHYVILNGTIIG